MATVDIQVKGSEELKRKLSQLGMDLNDFSQELSRTGEYLHGFYSRDVFESAGGAIEESWQPLSPKTIERKGSSTILVETGRMQDAFNYRVSPRVMVLYNPTPYFAYHQMGTRKMPQRMIHKVTETVAQKIGELFQEVLNQRLKEIWQ